MKKKLLKIIVAILYSILMMIIGAWVGISLLSFSSKTQIADTSQDSSAISVDSSDTQQETISEEETAAKQETSTEEHRQTVPDQSDDSSSISDVYYERASELLAQMSLREKIYQMFIVTQEQLTGYSTVTKSGDATKEAINRQPVGGIIYFEPNIISPEQCRKMIENIQNFSPIGLFIAVDEEGGRVARLGNNSSMGTTTFPSMKSIGSTDKTDNAYDVGKTIGTELYEFGFNVDFAPVADIDPDSGSSGIGDRSFGSDAEDVAAMVSATVKGFKDSDTLCTLKHYPGHGATQTDSHNGYTELPKSLDELRKSEFLPFQTGIDAGADFVMVGHLSVPEVTDDELPATLSKPLIDILKGELGFTGIIITDSMSMGAITERYSSGEAAVKAIQAGVDIILMPKSLNDAVYGIEEAVNEGTITEERIDESVMKILQKKLVNNIIS